MSVHDHHNDPNDPVNQPRKRSRSTMDPVDRSVDPADPLPVRNQGMGPGGWLLALLALVIIGGIIYSMSGPTTTATNTGTPPAGSSTTGSGTGSNPAATPPATGSQTTPPAAPAPAR